METCRDRLLRGAPSKRAFRSDIFPRDESRWLGESAEERASQWKKPCEAAILELDDTKLQQRISEAHQAILDRLEQLRTPPSDGEQRVLNDPLRNLRILRKLSEVGADGCTKMLI